MSVVRIKEQNPSDEKIIKVLEYIRDTESERNVSDMDCDLVKICVDYIVKLKGYKIVFDEKDVEERVSRIPFVD